MTVLQRYSAPFHATGGVAAEGAINPLGRPNIEPLEVLVREAVQNCWDAKRSDSPGIEVEIRRRRLDVPQVDTIRRRVLPSPPTSLAISDHLVPGVELLSIADFGTGGLGGPTRADRFDGSHRDFVDFVRNIGQRPDKELGGGSFGYGKAAFYLASKARTIIIDTLCRTADDTLERRLIACAWGESYVEDGVPYTGRHWWGILRDGVPEPAVNEEADELAGRLGLPHRAGVSGMGTTVAVVAPGIYPETEDGPGDMMEFIADCLVWNFWPRMITTHRGSPTMSFRVIDDSQPIAMPDPRTHPRLRGFVEAFDRLATSVAPSDDDFTIDRVIECKSPRQELGRLVISRGVASPPADLDGPAPQGARDTAAAIHHVALMRNAELVVKYLPGPASSVPRQGYSGVFRCSREVDEAFRQSEPPTHDDWVAKAVRDARQRSFVNVALERVAGVCREAAGPKGNATTSPEGASIPLGEFADALAALMPAVGGTGARRRAPVPRAERVRRTVVHSPRDTAAADVWVDGAQAVSAGSGEVDAWPPSVHAGTSEAGAGDTGLEGGTVIPPGVGDQLRRPGGRPRPPQTRPGGDPTPALADDRTPVLRFPFEVKAHGNTVRLTAVAQVMTGDGEQAEDDPPAGWSPPVPRTWHLPNGAAVDGPAATATALDADGTWQVDLPLIDEALLRIGIEVVAL